MKRLFYTALVVAITMVVAVACNSTQNGSQTAEQPQDAAAAKNGETAAANVDIKPGEVNVISEDQFIALVTDVENDKGFQYRGSVPAVVDCYADWCRPCHAINPIMVELAQEYEGRVIFYKLNVDRAARVSSALNITSIPSLFFFKPNSQPAKIVGAHPKEDYIKAINELLLNE